MKRIILLIAVIAIVLPSCQKINDELDALDNRIDKLEQTLPSIEEQIENINAQLISLKAIDDDIKAQIAELEKNDSATATEIADLKAKDSALEKSICDLQRYVDTQIADAKSESAAAYATIEQYHNIVEQLSALRSSTNKLGEDLTAKINAEVKSLSDKITDLENRLKSVEDKLEDLLARIQSVSYIPTYSDGKATVKYYDSTSHVTLDFEVSPKDAVAELARVWRNALSVTAVYTQTRSVSFIDMPIVAFESDMENGIISVTASGENLSEEFFAGTQEVSARVSISDGNNSVTSEYIPLVAKFSIPTNELWYTSTDCKVITPNDPNVFGANIVSNTYENGRGVILFDAPITSIGECAFSNWSNLIDVTIPDSVISIGNYAFSHCSMLQAFYGDYASDDNRCLIIDGKLVTFAPAGLTEYTIPDSVTSIGARGFIGCAHLTSVIIPNSITSIESSAFAYCTSLESVTIGNSVTSIGNWAFENCTSLTDILIPDNVTSIGDGAFSICTSLTNVNISDSVISIGEHTFSGCTSLTSVAIPDSVTLIGSYAFYDCSNLTSVIMPDSLTSIKSYTFACCVSLENVTIGNRVTSIEEGAFSICTSLTSIAIPNSVTLIGAYVFYNCSSLTSVIIPNNTTSIGECAFSYCNSLTDIYCKPTTPPTGGSYMFGENASSRKIYVPRNSVDAYKSAEAWSEYTDYIVGYDF